MTSFTSSQKLATDPKTSARVMANAGAGKTYVLTARVLRLLLDGVHPGKVLCLTYTKAAAAEMVRRISERLQGWALSSDVALRTELAVLIEENPSDEQMAIARKLFSAMLESSPPPRIQTIHSFCQEVLKRFPLESGVAPYFEVVDDTTSRELINETMQRLLSKIQVKNEVIAAVDFIATEAGEWKFDELTHEIIQQRNRLRDVFEAANDPDDIVELVYRKHGLPRNLMASEIIAEFFQFHDLRKAEVERLAFAMQNSSNENDVERGTKLAAALKEKDFAAYLEIFCTQKYEAKQVKSIITQAGKKNFEEADELIAFEQDLILEAHDKILMVENLRFTSHVVYLAHGLLEAYEGIKKTRAVLDYNDLIYYTKKLLNSASSAAWVLYKLDGGIDHILIDEAQDTSPEQWQIVTALTEEFMSGQGAAERNRTVFIVGDEKQSIYSFQGADRETFNAVVEFIRARSVAAEKVFSDITLPISYRSVEAVLKLADAAFEPENLRKSISSSPKAVAHELNRLGAGGRVEIWPLVVAEEKEKLEPWRLPLGYVSAKSADLLLAEKIAETIAEWIKSGRKLVSENRAIKASDILILLRSRGGLADMLIRKLKSNNIAVSGSDRLKIIEHIAVQDLISLANFLLLPSDDLSLAEVLKSPLFGVSEEELFELCHGRESTIWHVIQNSSKFDNLHKGLKILLDKVDFIPVYELYSLILDQLGGRKKFISRLGAEVNDVLDEFLDLSLNFERSHTNSLQQFIQWICVSNMEIKRDMEQGGEMVRVMTVHGAKGLEAPIVFIADAAKMPTPKRQLLWDDGLFYSYRRKTVLGSGLRLASDAAETADYEEYLRLLYVAVTRARDELYVCGSQGEKKVNIDKSWYRIIENSLKKFGVANPKTGAVFYETPQVKIVEPKPAKPEVKNIGLPKWAAAKLPEEKAHRLELQEKEIFGTAEQISRGKQIHKTLELAADIPAEKLAEYLKRNNSAQLEKIFTAPEFAEIFGAGSRAEVPVIGDIDGEIINARIDRLVVTNDVIKIVDFKTSQTPAREMPQSYINQMVKYKKLVALQYPGRAIHSFILWVPEGILVEVA